MQKLDKTQTEEAVEVLFDAFYNDHYFNHIFENDENKTKYMKSMLEGWLVYCLMYGEVWYEVKDNKITGILGYLTPENTDWSEDKFIKSGLREIESIIPEEFKEKRRQCMKSFDLIEGKVPDNHIYFYFVAVDPKYQGQGIGKNLVNKILDYSKEVKAPILLDTEEENNVNWYLRLGFKKLNEDNPISPIPMWFMLREN